MSFREIFMVIVVLFCFNKDACSEEYKIWSGINDGQIVSEVESQKKDLYRAQSDIDKLDSKSERISDDLEGIKKEVNELDKYLWIITTLLLTFFGSGLSFFYFYIRKYLSNLKEKIINDIKQASESALKKIEAEATENLEVFINKKIKRIEEDYYRYIYIISMRMSKQYDDVLKFSEWSGDFKKYSKYPDFVQRAMIACVCKSKTITDEERSKSWSWAKYLISKEVSLANMIALIKTGNDMQVYIEVIDLYNSHFENLSKDDQEKCEVYLFISYRKAGDDYPLGKEKMQEIAERIKNNKDIRVKTNIAAFYRDEGKFTDADSLMSPDIRRYSGIQQGHMPEGWENLFNTYVANSIDRSMPSQSISQVKTILNHNDLRPDLIFNCARLAWKLPKNDENRGDFFKWIKRRYDDGFMPEKDEGTIKTLAILTELGFFNNENSKDSESEQLLFKAIKNSSRSDDEKQFVKKYYYICMLAEIYEFRGGSLNIEKAITCLKEIVHEDKIGEASYFLARGYALRGNNQTGDSELTLIYLEAAGKIKKKWIKRAKYDEVFNDCQEVHELISKYAHGDN